MRDFYRRGTEWEPLENGKCKFCGCSNKQGQRQHIRVTKIIDKEDGCELGYGVYCDNCSAQTKIFEKPVGAMASWRAGDCTIPVQSEEQILEGCIDLLQGLTEVFKEYLEFMGVEPDGEEEIFSHEIPVSKIVNRLFLYHTNHSGGTSTHAKCNELGTHEKYGWGVTLLCNDEEEDEDDE